MAKKIATVILCMLVLAAGPTGVYATVSTGTATEEKPEPVLDGLLEEDGSYHYYKNGKMAVEKWVSLDDSKYYFGKNGRMSVGIILMDKKFFCFSKNGKYNAEKTAKIRKAAKYEKPFAKLKKLIGEPKKAKYYASCYGNGKDGVLAYRGFKVYTFKPAKGKEIFLSAE